MDPVATDPKRGAAGQSASRRRLRGWPAAWLATLALTLSAGAGAPVRAAASHVPGAPAAGASFSLPAPGTHAPTPRRLITLAPHITELVFAAGAGSRIVGTVASSDYPPQARRIPRVGNGIQLDTERIVALRPDLILAWQPSGATRALAPLLARLNIPLAYVQPRALRDIPREIITLGRKLGTSAVAGREAQALSDRIAALGARYQGQRPVSTFIEVGTAPLYTLGKAPLINDVLHICGGTNIFAGAPIPAPQVSVESVLQDRPDAVIIASADPRRVTERTRYWASLSLPAARNHHVYGLDPDKLFRPGPRLIDAAQALCQDLVRAR
jgi:iron complex transport system substrate-binding protein/vitamin B12 transport system substrate-binding protein